MVGFKAKMKVTSLVCLIILIVTPPTLASTLPNQKNHSNLIIQATRKSSTANYTTIVLHPSKEIYIQAAPLNLSKEKEDFQSFKLHYVVFWALFFGMRLVTF